MANSIVNNELWSGQFIERLAPINIGLSFCDTATLPGDGHGDKVYVLNATGVATGAYTPGSNITLGNAVTTKEALALDQKDYWGFYIDDVEEAQSDPATVGKLMQAAAEKLSETLDKYIFSLVANAAASNKISGASSAALLINEADPADNTGDLYDLLVEANVRLTIQNAPQANRWVCISPQVYGMALRHPDFIRASQFGDRVVSTSRFAAEGGPLSTGLDTPGFVGSLAGMHVYTTNNLLKAGTDDVNAYITYGQGTPLTVATQLSKVTVSEPDLQFGKVIKQLLVFGGKVFTENAKKLGSIYVKNS